MSEMPLDIFKKLKNLTSPATELNYLRMYNQHELCTLWFHNISMPHAPHECSS